MSDNDILWLDVQVEYAPGMEVVETLEDLRNVGHDIILRVTEPSKKTLGTPLLVIGNTTVMPFCHIMAL